ncbi:hypothetical protein OPV22_003333 [Ensete ventricosum]|uniref:Secreted protein n=1 Tax=Ensete ventricosum TaxID=4639 RepID=A0AAV8S0I6_ENSVE|nr:hypothetical protein OPV22_003333 [Ensete ventricosum]
MCGHVVAATITVFLGPYHNGGAHEMLVHGRCCLINFLLFLNRMGDQSNKYKVRRHGEKLGHRKLLSRLCSLSSAQICYREEISGNADVGKDRQG